MKSRENISGFTVGGSATYEVSPKPACRLQYIHFYLARTCIWKLTGYGYNTLQAVSLVGLEMMGNKLA